MPKYVCCICFAVRRVLSLFQYNLFVLNSLIVYLYAEQNEQWKRAHIFVDSFSHFVYAFVSILFCLVLSCSLSPKRYIDRSEINRVSLVIFSLSAVRFIEFIM